MAWNPNVKDYYPLQWVMSNLEDCRQAVEGNMPETFDEVTKRYQPIPKEWIVYVRAATTYEVVS